MTLREGLKVEEVVSRLCRMPIDFYGGRSKSMLQLVSESGVDWCPAALTVQNLAAYIANHTEVIEGWLRWSQKPLPSGWYFERQGSAFVVGFYPNGEELKIEEPAVACAEYMVREVKHLTDVRRRHRARGH